MVLEEAWPLAMECVCGSNSNMSLVLSGSMTVRACSSTFSLHHYIGRVKENNIKTNKKIKNNKKYTIIGVEFIVIIVYNHTKDD